MATQRDTCLRTRGSSSRVAPKKMNVPDSGLTMENRAPNASRKVVTEIPFESRALALGARSRSAPQRGILPYGPSADPAVKVQAKISASTSSGTKAANTQKAAAFAAEMEIPSARPDILAAIPTAAAPTA
jgi:hypothetical protein